MFHGWSGGRRFGRGTLRDRGYCKLLTEFALVRGLLCQFGGDVKRSNTDDRRFLIDPHFAFRHQKEHCQQNNVKNSRNDRGRMPAPPVAPAIPFEQQVEFGFRFWRGEFLRR